MEYLNFISLFLFHTSRRKSYHPQAISQRRKYRESAQILELSGASGRAHIVRWTMVLRRPKRSVDLQRCAVEVCHAIAWRAPRSKNAEAFLNEIWNKIMRGRLKENIRNHSLRLPLCCRRKENILWRYEYWIGCRAYIRQFWTRSCS